MRILRHRRTRHFVALLIECGCRRSFLHRLDRPVVACYHCGRVRDLGVMIGRLRVAEEGEQRRAPRAARRVRAA